MKKRKQAQGVVTSTGIKVKREKKDKVPYRERFLHAFPVLPKKDDSQYLGVKYPDYYRLYKDWNAGPDGSKFFVRTKKKRKEVDQALKEANPNAYQDAESGKRLTQTFLGISRILKRFIIGFTLAVFILMIIVSAAIHSFQGDFGQIMTWPWIYITTGLAWAVSYYWFLVRRAYYYSTFTVDKLQHNIEIALSERLEMQEVQAEAEKRQSESYLNYQTYANDAATRKIGIDGISRAVKGSLYTAIFNPQLKIDEHGLVRLTEASKWDFLGLPITTFDLLTPDDVRFVQLNGYVSGKVWHNQKNPAFYRKQMNTGKEQAAPYKAMYDKMGDQRVKTEAYLLYKMAHALLVAKTGAGKTGYVIMYSLISIMMSKSQPSIFFNSKGDDAKFIYSWALICGYNYVNLALNSPNTSDKYNPLSEVWNTVYTIYALENEEIIEMNIPLAEYIKGYNFSLRRMSFSDKRGWDNLYYAKTDDKAFIRYFRDSTTGNYLYNASDILGEIVRQSEDYTLQDDLFRGSSYRLEKMEPEFFIRFFLSKYNRSRTKYPNYVIGKITHNIAIPFQNDEESHNFWYEDGGWEKEKHWYLCGTYAFISKQFIFDNKEQIIQKLNNSYHTVIETLVPVLTGTDPNGASGENAVFSDSAIGVIKFFIKAFCAKVLRDGPDVAAEEYFTLQQISRVAKQFENKSYSADEEMNKFLEATNDPHLGYDTGYDPYTRLSNIMRPYDGEIDSGFDTATSRIKETWGGMVANVQTQLKKIGGDNLFAATCYSSFNLHLFYIQPTIIVTTASGPLNLVISIMFEDLFNIWLQETEQSNKEPHRPIIFLLDEFSTIKWNNEPLFEHLQDGRSRRMFVIIIAQTRKMIQEKQGETLLDSAKVNGLLRLSLGEATDDDAQITSREMGTYKGTNFENISSQEDLSDLQKLSVRNDIPYITPNEVLRAGLGHKFGKLDLVEKSGVFFDFQDKVYYSSQTNEILTSNPLFKPIPPPKFDFAPLSYQLRFDYGINIIYYSSEENATQEHSFAKKFKQFFPEHNDLSRQKQLDENLIALNPAKFNTYKQATSKLMELNKANKAKYQAKEMPVVAPATVQEFALTFDERSLDTALLQTPELFNVSTKNAE